MALYGIALVGADIGGGTAVTFLPAFLFFIVCRSYLHTPPLMGKFCISSSYECLPRIVASKRCIAGTAKRSAAVIGMLKYWPALAASRSDAYATLRPALLYLSIHNSRCVLFQKEKARSVAADTRLITQTNEVRSYLGFIFQTTNWR